MIRKKINNNKIEPKNKNQKEFLKVLKFFQMNIETEIQINR